MFSRWRDPRAGGALLSEFKGNLDADQRSVGQGELHDWPLLSEIVIAWFYQIQGTQPQHQGTWTRYIVTPILFRKLGFQPILLFTNHQIESKWQSRNSRNLPNTFFKSFQSNSIFTDSPKSRSVPFIIYLIIFRCSSSTHSMSRSGFGLRLGAGWDQY